MKVDNYYYEAVTIMRVDFKFVWCPGQNKRIAPPSFFHGCRKRRLND
jgi:hypothetical protein